MRLATLAYPARTSHAQEEGKHQSCEFQRRANYLFPCLFFLKLKSINKEYISTDYLKSSVFQMFKTVHFLHFKVCESVRTVQ